MVTMLARRRSSIETMQTAMININATANLYIVFAQNKKEKAYGEKFKEECNFVNELIDKHMAHQVEMEEVVNMKMDQILAKNAAME